MLRGVKEGMPLVIKENLIGDQIETHKRSNGHTNNQNNCESEAFKEILNLAHFTGYFGDKAPLCRFQMEQRIEVYWDLF